MIDFFVLSPCLPCTYSSHSPSSHTIIRIRFIWWYFVSFIIHMPLFTGCRTKTTDWFYFSNVWRSVSCNVKSCNVLDCLIFHNTCNNQLIRLYHNFHFLSCRYFGFQFRSIFLFSLNRPERAERMCSVEFVWVTFGLECFPVNLKNLIIWEKQTKRTRGTMKMLLWSADYNSISKQIS